MNSNYEALAGGVNAFGGMGRDFGHMGRGFGTSLGGASGGGAARLLGVGTLNPAGDLAFSAWNGRAVSIVDAFAYESTWANLHGWVTGGEALRGANYDICWALGFPTTKTFADVNAGTEDANYNQLFDEMIAARPSQTIIYLRVMPEFQLSANVWYSAGAETAYKAAFVRIVGLARAKSAKFKIIFNPNYTTSVAGTPYDPMLAYPGDAYVDEFGQDVYKISAFDGDGAAAWNIRLTETYGLNWLVSTAAAHNKPIAIPEWGVDNDADSPFITSMAAWILANRVSFHCYFDVDNGAFHLNKISSNQYPTVSTTFIAAFGVPAVATAPIPVTTNVFVAYSMRRLTSYTGPLVRLRRISDSVEQDFSATGGDGTFVDTAAIATFVGGSSATVVTWYDQGPNGFNIGQATTANQPAYAATGIGAQPGLTFDGTNDVLTRASTAWAAADLNAFAVFKIAAGSNYRSLFGIGQTATAGIEIMPNMGGNSVDWLLNDAFMQGNGSNSGLSPRAVVTLPANTDAAIHQHDMKLAAGGNDWVRDGVTKTLRATSAAQVPAITATMMVGGRTGAFTSGAVGEFVLFNTVYASRTTFRANQKSAWGTP